MVLMEGVRLPATTYLHDCILIENLILSDLFKHINYILFLAFNFGFSVIEKCYSIVFLNPG